MMTSIQSKCGVLQVLIAQLTSSAGETLSPASLLPLIFLPSCSEYIFAFCSTAEVKLHFCKNCKNVNRKKGEAASCCMCRWRSMSCTFKDTKLQNKNISSKNVFDSESWVGNVKKITPFHFWLTRFQTCFWHWLGDWGNS